MIIGKSRMLMYSSRASFVPQVHRQIEQSMLLSQSVSTGRNYFATAFVVVVQLRVM